MGRASNLWGVAFWMLWSVALALAEPVFVVDRVQVNIRADATIQAERIAVLDQGDEVEFLRRKDEWFQVRMSDGRNGWVHGDLVQERVIVLGGKVHLHTSASLQAQSLATLGQEQELGRSRQVGDWSEVALGDGRNGWILSRFLRAKTTNIAEITTPSAAVVAIPQEQPPAVEALPEPESTVALQRNNYAEGLTFESNGNYRQALSSFEAVLRQEPKHLKALYHAAQAHIRLDQLDAGLAKLYTGLEHSEGRPDNRYYLALGEIYRLKAQPDSIRKYQALFKGEIYPSPVPASNEMIVAPDLEDEGMWIGTLLIGGGLGIGLLVAVALWWGRRGRGKREDTADQEETKPPKGKFNQVMEEADKAPLEDVGPGEEEELDRQIDEKWAVLQQGASSFVKPETWKGTQENLEENHLEDLLGFIEDLRAGLEQQDQRSALYADIVRLQNMKIEALNDEVRLLRRRQGTD